MIPEHGKSEQNPLNLDPGKLLDILFDQTALCLAIVDRSFRIVQANNSWQQNFGDGRDPSGSHYPAPERYPTEERYFDLIPLFEEVFRRKESMNKSFLRLQSRDGITFWNALLQPITGEKETEEYLFLGLVNVTDEVKAEENLAVLNFALDNVREAAFLTSENGRFLYVNEEACRTLGYTRAELLSMSVGDIEIFYTEKRWKRSWSSARKRKSIVLESQHRTREGRILPVEISANYFEFDGAGYVIGLARNISERKKSEQTIALMNFAMDNVRDAAFLIRSDGSFPYVNDAACLLLDYTKTELLELGIPGIAPEYPIDRWKERWDGLKREKHILVESEVRRKNGKLCPIEININYFEFNNQEYVLATARDISERKKAEEERRTHTLHFEHMDRINQILQSGTGYESVLGDVLDSVLSIFGCDRAWLLYPCEPSSPIWRVPVEKTRPEYPGAFPIGIDALMSPDIARICETLRNSSHPVAFLPEQIPEEVAKNFSVLSGLGMCFFPKGDVPWMFGLHQCTHPSVWTLAEKTLFQEIGRRLSDALEGFLAKRLQQRLNRELQAISNCNQTLLRAESEKSLLEDVCEIICRDAGYKMAWAGYVEHNKEKSIRLAAWAGVEDLYISSIPWTWSGDSKYGQGPVGRAARTGEIVYSQGSISAGSDPWIEKGQLQGYHSKIALPLKDEKNQVLGVLAIYSVEVNAFTPGEVRLLEELANDLAFGIRNLRLRTQRSETFEKLERSLETTVMSIATTLEIRDPYTAGHQKRVARLAAAIATELGMNEDTAKGIFIAATLHDIGKIWVPAEILSRPGKLTAAEMDLIRTHSEVGYNIIKDIDFPWPVAAMVLQHHERIDGSGYPMGLRGEEIHPGARILCVADVVESMAAHRPYRPALGIDTALREIEKERGVLYDTKTVNACLSLFRSRRFSFT